MSSCTSFIQFKKYQKFKEDVTSVFFLLISSSKSWRVSVSHYFFYGKTWAFIQSSFFFFFMGHPKLKESQGKSIVRGRKQLRFIISKIYIYIYICSEHITWEYIYIYIYAHSKLCKGTPFIRVTSTCMTVSVHQRLILYLHTDQHIKMYMQSFW